MLLLTANKLSYHLPGRTLLEDASLSLDKGDKVGLIGRNGSGKSTLLRLLTGDLKPDNGEVTLRGQTTVRILDQLPTLEGEDGQPLREVVGRGCGELFRLRQQYDETCQALETPSDDEAEQTAIENRLNRLTDQLTLHDAWDLETRADQLLTTLGFPDPNRLLVNMSGGELKRVAMARTLLVPPDILLLDEPTNHLDIVTISWLEKFLMNAPFTVLMVTHDRFFLERVCSRIVEIANSTTQEFAGNYSAYLEQRAEREAQAARQQERFDNILRQEQAWMRQGAKARSTKQKARLQRVQAMIDGGSGVAAAAGATEDAAWDLGTHRLGKKVIEIQGVGCRVLKPLDFRLEPGERVGLVGANGSGKTTFLDLLAQKLTPETGTLEIGDTVHTGYFDQHTNRLKHLPGNTRVLDAVKDVAFTLPLSNGKEVSAARLCEMFLFTGPSQATLLEKLSGGEKKRLELLRLLMERPNLFLLDEPTNDLDIETLQRLEYFLDGFPGCVCIASHDRFLLQRLCDRILIFRDGQIEDALPEVLDVVGSDFFELSSVPPERTLNSAPTPSPSKTKKRKLTYKEESELKTLEAEVPRLESRLEELEKEMAEKATNYKAVKELFTEKEATAKQLERTVERWAELEDLKEALTGD